MPLIMKLSEWSLKWFQLVPKIVHFSWRACFTQWMAVTWQVNVKASVNNTVGTILFTGSRIFGNENMVIKGWILIIRYCHETLLNILQVVELVIKNIETNSKRGLYWVKGNVYIWIPMPVLMPRCRCRDFQMAVNKYTFTLEISNCQLLFVTSKNMNIQLQKRPV